MKEIFNTSEKTAIKEAISDLESNTSGELMVYYTESSDSYEETYWQLGAIFGFIASLLIALYGHLWMLPIGFDATMFGVFVAFAIILGYSLAYYVPAIRLVLLDKATIEKRAISKAKEVFLEKEIFQLPNRAGILLYISLEEHEVVLLAGEGINQKVTSQDWVQVIEDIIEGKKRKRLSKGVVEAIHKCEEILKNAGFTESNGSNYLSDEVQAG